MIADSTASSLDITKKSKRSCNTLDESRISTRYIPVPSVGNEYTIYYILLIVTSVPVIFNLLTVELSPSIFTTDTVIVSDADVF